jgi:soluble lytic murein transglycosylase-like protein
MFRKCSLFIISLLFVFRAHAALPYQAWETYAAKYDLSVQLLYAIALKESGKTVDGEFKPHPYAIGIGVHKSLDQLSHQGLYFDSKEEAVYALQELLKAGYLNLGLGMMQINIMANPDIVENYADLFEPEINIQAAGKIIEYCKRFGTVDRLLSCYSHGNPNAEGGKRYAATVFNYQNEYGKRFARLRTPQGQLTYQQFLQFTQYTTAPTNTNPVGQVKMVTMLHE